MAEARGYYSLIQFCPDLSRLEAANLGVALYCPEGPAGRFIDARVSAGNDRARRFFSGRALDLGRLNAAKDALRSRLLVEGQRFSSAEDFRRFAASCANDLQMTEPRPLRTGDPARDLELLFDELVDRRRRRQPKAPLLPELDALFRRLAPEGRAELDRTVLVPRIHRSLTVPYAYRNGVTNLVNPQRFPVDERGSTDRALPLAAEGRLIAEHPELLGDERCRLVVVARFEERGLALLPSPAATEGIERTLAGIFSEFDVKFIPQGQVDRFLREVDEEAHR